MQKKKKQLFLSSITSQYYFDRLATVVFVIKLINIAEKCFYNIPHCLFGEIVTCIVELYIYSYICRG